VQFPDINAGAELAAAGKTLGMSPDETYDFVIRKIQLTNAKRARQGLPPIEESAAFRGFLDKMAKVRGIDEVYPADIDDKRTVPNFEVEYGEFGNQDELQNFGGIDEQGRIKDAEAAGKELDKARGKKDPNEIVRYYYDKVARKPAQEVFYAGDGQPIPERFQEAAKAKDFGLYRKDVPAPAQQVLRGELERLQAGIDQYGADTFPGIADVVGRIEDDLRVNSDAEASLARELVKRDLGNVNPEVVEANDWKADAVAQEIAQRRFGVGGGGAAADAAIGKIGDIQNLGAVKNKGPGGQAQVTMPVPGRQVEPTSLPIGLANDLNAPVTDNRFAGPLQKQEQWLIDHQPGFREGKVFGDFPQIAIDAQLEGVGEALAKLKLGQQGLDPSYARIRNLNDLQAAADEVIRIAGIEGIKFFDKGDNGNVFNPNPGIEQVLNRARFNENQKNDLARALFQVEAANRNPANANRKARFKKGKPEPRNGEMGGRRLVAIQGENGKEFRVVRAPAKQPVGGAQHQDLGGGQIPIGRIGREKIEGREVKGELQKLDGRRADPPLDRIELRNARMPDQAVRGGEKAPRAGFIKGDVRAMSRAERVRKFGERNAAIANRIEDRFNAAEEARVANAGPVNNMGRIETPNRGVGRIIPGLDYGDEFPQSATSAVVNPRASVSPEMGGGSVPPKPPVMAPAMSPEPEGSYRPIDDSIRNQLGELNSGDAVQGPRQPMIPRERSFGERADYAINKIKGYAKSPRYTRGRRIGYATAGTGAGIVGLDALIGGEREKREEEAMYR